MVNMRWWLPITVTYPFCGPLQADALGSFSTSTNYLWRGVTQADDNPSASISLEYLNRQGGYLGAWISNTDYDDASSYKVNLYLAHRLIFEPVETEVLFATTTSLKVGSFVMTSCVKPGIQEPATRLTDSRLG